MSNVNASFEEIYDLTIESATCTNGSAMGVIKLVEGENIENLVFVFNEVGEEFAEGMYSMEHTSLPIKINEIPVEGETKIYNLDYEERGILFKANRVDLNIVVNGTYYHKDTKEC